MNTFANTSASARRAAMAALHGRGVRSKSVWKGFREGVRKGVTNGIRGSVRGDIRRGVRQDARNN